MPAQTVQSALMAAGRRGVDVHVGWSPGEQGAWWTWRAREQAAAMVRAGVQVHELTGRAQRARSSVIDGVWSCVGSSLGRHGDRLDGDMNLIVLDADFAARVEAAFRDDVARASRPAAASSRLREPLHRLNVRLSRYLEFGQ
jgi:cardiolipin synthase